MKNHISISHLSIPKEQLYHTEAVSLHLDQLAVFKIEQVNWSEFPYKPEVSFKIAYQENALFLKYYVAEQNTQALYTEFNDPVYKDSCVEFFISLNEDEHYYNFEFNCKGTCLAAYGKNKLERDFLDKNLLKKISYQSKINQSKNKEGLIEWELTLIIPLEVFCHHQLDSFSGLKGKANFYKCGDDLPEPHFLSWNPIISEEPNFHLPAYFGEIEFSPK